jgi:hypothetical protein
MASDDLERRGEAAIAADRELRSRSALDSASRPIATSSRRAPGALRLPDFNRDALLDVVDGALGGSH